MLKFIFGRAASGKTYEIFSQIKKQVESGNENVMLLVPEQFTFECEKEMLHMLGAQSSTAVPVLSFTRLSDEVGRYSGGISGRRLDDSGRLVFMCRALRAVKDELLTFGRYANDSRFAKNLLATIDEFKNCGIDNDSLRSAARTTGGALESKLLDIALISDTYDALIKNKFSDPSDDMARLWHQLNSYAYFAERTVYIDSFKNFGGAQLKIVEQILRQARDVVISMCFDPFSETEASVFANVAATVSAVRRIANKYGVGEEKPQLLEGGHYSGEDVAALEYMLATGNDDVFEADAPNITVCRAGSVYDEAEFAAAQIRRLVRENNCRYRDIVVICRKDEQYIEAVRHTCEQYDIPCYTGKKENIASLPLTVFVESAMSAALSLTTDGILDYLKTGLAGLDCDEISELENYVYIWKINGAGWKTDWDMSPSGFEKPEPDDGERLQRINSLRLRAITPLMNFIGRFNGSAQQMATAVWQLMEDCGAANKLVGIQSELDPQSADFSCQGYDALVGILDSLVTTLENSNCTKKDFTEYFCITAAATQIGAIPQMLDEITFGAADCIRPSRPKAVFVLGLNSGVFPSLFCQSGIIGGGERKKLIEAQLPLRDNGAEYSVDENFLVYSSVCCASDRVYLSYSNYDSAMAEVKPSLIIDTVTEKFPNCRKETAGSRGIDLDMIETPAAAFTQLLKNINDPNAASLEEALCSKELYKDRLDGVKRIQNDEQPRLDPEISQQLFGADMNLSASGIDTYFRCNFMYFCRYGLRAKVLKAAEIDVLQRGTMVHAVLEKTVTCKNGRLADMSDAQIDSEIDAAIEEYLSGIKGLESVADNRFRFIVSQIRSLCGEVVRHIRDEFRNSSFEPLCCELKIGGEDSDIEQPVIPLENGSIHLRGAVDRLDGCGAYIRVVDYKTGKRKFSLPDVLFGLNMQMLIYLYAVSESQKFADKVPTGVLYLETSRKVGEEKNFVMNGVISRDENVVLAMDRNNSGNFIPSLRRKKDGSFYASNSFVEQDAFNGIFRRIERLLQQMGNSLHDGRIPVSPLDSGDSNACKYCEFSSVCGIENRPHKAIPKMTVKDAEDIFIKDGEPGV